MADQTSIPPGPAPAGFRNTQARFGRVTKTFHWLVALLIFSMVILGLAAQYWPYDTANQLAVKATLFSTHKTLGLFTFAVALARIGWAITQPRPVLLTADDRLQTFAAETVHYALYGALVLVPLTGWIHHAATTGFAPIWWPFGQSLFFVPQTQDVAHTFGILHFVSNILLVTALGLHIGGALKHHLIDHDATLKRMLPGTCALPANLSNPSFHRTPIMTAAFLWCVALGIGVGIGAADQLDQHAPTPAATLAAAPSEWAVQSGDLSITVAQFGQPVTGAFSDWTAAINFSEVAVDGRHGDVVVTVAIPSLTLGGVTDQALGGDFLNADGFAIATFTGQILPADAGYIVDGMLDLVGQSVPVQLPFALTLGGDMATASGAMRIDRRDFGIGTNYDDEGTVGFSVDIMFDLVATRGSALETE